MLITKMLIKWAKESIFDKTRSCIEQKLNCLMKKIKIYARYKNSLAREFNDRRR